MCVGCRDQASQQRRFGAGRYRDIRPLRNLDHAQRVRQGQVQRHIARYRRDCFYVKLG